MEYTLANAAKAVQVNKSTVLRAIARGRLSARREEDGSYRIDGAELARVYELHLPARTDDAAHPPGARWRAPGEAPAATPTLDVQSMVELATLRVEVRMLGAQLDHERETAGATIDDLRRRLDRAEERVLALSASPAAPAAPPPPEKPQEAQDAAKAEPEPEPARGTRPRCGLLGWFLGTR